MNNLFVSYDLYKPGQPYLPLEMAIKSLGTAIKVHQTFWYVKSSATAAEAKNRLIVAIDQNDTLVVVDATNDTVATYNVKPEAAKLLQANCKVFGLSLQDILGRSPMQSGLTRKPSLRDLRLSEPAQTSILPQPHFRLSDIFKK